MHHHHLYFALNSHVFWTWFTFLFGAGAYIVKRAYYQITGPNPVANGTGQYIKRASIPIGFRLIADSGLFAVLFEPPLLQGLLQSLGRENIAQALNTLTQYKTFALFFGMAVDPMMDWVIPTFVGKLPFLKDWWPQMPGPLPQQAPPDPDHKPNN